VLQLVPVVFFLIRVSKREEEGRGQERIQGGPEGSRGTERPREGPRREGPRREAQGEPRGIPRGDQGRESPGEGSRREGDQKNFGIPLFVGQGRLLVEGQETRAQLFPPRGY
jgi:hypothetical protein